MATMLQGERSLGSILHDVAENLGRIVRAEVRLARIEVAEQVTAATREKGKAVGMLVAGVAVGQLALGLVLLACVRGFEQMIAPWVASLVVAVGAGAVAWALVSIGFKQLKGGRILPPRRLDAPTGTGT